MQSLVQVFNICLAALCGSAIGFERTKRLKDAGVRTHCIIATAAALFMIISKYGFADLTENGEFLYGTHGADPARIAAQVIAGISWVGAGVIFRNGDSLKGLSTAAGLWATAGIGLAVGGGMYVLGIAATLCVVLIQVVFHQFSIGFDAFSENEISLVYKDNDEIESLLNEVENKGGIRIKRKAFIKVNGEIQKETQIMYRYKYDIDELTEILAKHESVIKLVIR